MISSLKFSAPHYAASLEALADKTLTFKELVLAKPDECLGVVLRY